MENNLQTITNLLQELVMLLKQVESNTAPRSHKINAESGEITHERIVYSD